MKTVRVLIEGRVQGVWYRGWTVEEATQRTLNGWVRNRSDGRVEAVFSGDDAKVDSMIQACRAGPPAANVRSVSTEPYLDDPGFGFVQKATV